ncbi:MAG: hypothetical protein ACOX9C_05475 [Kiritimatiellia bacterium]|jgi:hypothetical protein
MRTQVTFRSNKFPPCEGEQDQINPGCWGKRLAEYICEAFKGAGIEIQDINPEDWGWYISIKNKGFRLALCCGHQQGDDDEFLCFTDPSAPLVRKLFRKIDATEQLARIVKTLDKVLSADPDIWDIEWSEP